MNYSREEAYEMGKAAFLAGERDCPFINWGEGHKLWMAWNQGWKDECGKRKGEAIKAYRNARI